MSDPLPLPAGAAEILALFSGRRRGPRTPCSLPVECHGKDRPYRGTALNASRVGALLELAHRRFRGRGAQGLLAVAGRLYESFPNGIALSFPGTGLSVRATVVRITQEPTRGETLLGCMFDRPLTAAECQKLGVSAHEADLTE